MSIPFGDDENLRYIEQARKVKGSVQRMEIALVVSAIRNPDLIALAKLRPNAFSNVIARKIWSIIVRTPDPSAMGSEAWLAKLPLSEIEKEEVNRWMTETGDIIKDSDIPDVCMEIKKDAQRRKIASVMYQGLIDIGAGNADIEKVMSDVISAGYTSLSYEDYTDFSSFISESISDVEEKVLIRKLMDEEGDQSMTPPGFISTGYYQLDALGALELGTVVVIGARPSIGKTVFLSNLLLNIARQGVGVAYHALEMSKTQLGHRFLSRMFNVELHSIRNAEVDGNYFYSHNEYKKIDAMNFHLYVRPGQTIREIEAMLIQLKRHHDIQVVGIDHLGLIRDRMSHQTWENLDLITAEMQRIAKDMNICIILNHQLNRDAENRRPMLSDLRASGGIEQNADAVWLLHRDRIVSPDEPVQDFFVYVEKNRQDSVAEVKMKAELSKQIIYDPMDKNGDVEQPF
ncbi:MAG: hypothetical protein D6732_00120 [Methanobacteriota archaeon]|nr:MAG: hypothetical protein D6732_00120 [Euryarchaeota archaeon]